MFLNFSRTTDSVQSFVSFAYPPSKNNFDSRILNTLAGTFKIRNTWYKEHTKATNPLIILIRVFCNNIYFSKLILKREDNYAVSNTLESQNSQTHAGNSFARNSAPIVQVLEAEILLRSAVPSTDHFASHGPSVIRSVRLGIETQLGCTTMSCQLDTVRCSLCRTRHRVCPMPSVLFHQMQLSSLQ